MAAKGRRQSANGFDAPELDTAAYAPQYHPIAEGLQPNNENSGKQLAIERTPPYLYLKEGLLATTAHKPPHGTFSKFKWFGIGFGVCLTILAIALGVGLGVGLRQKASQTNSSPINDPDSNSTAKHGVLSDTSLSAIGTLDNNRHLFFQDNNGSIRHATYGQPISSWISEADYVYTNVMPKIHTPLSTILITYEGGEAYGDFGEIHLFYIGSDNTVQAICYGNGGQLTSGEPLFVAPDTRSLVINQLDLSQTNTTAEAALFFEAPNGNITVMHGFYYSRSEGPLNWVWHNVTDSIFNSMAKSNPWLAAPFASMPMSLENKLSFNLTAAFVNPEAIDNPSAGLVFLASIYGWQNSTPVVSDISTEYNGTSPAAIQKGDLLMVTIYSGFKGHPGAVSATSLGWVENGTFVGGVGGVSEGPPSSFPYARLASWASVNASTTYIYHQIDSTTLVEDTLLAGAGWTTTNITVRP